MKIIIIIIIIDRQLTHVPPFWRFQVKSGQLKLILEFFLAFLLTFQLMFSCLFIKSNTDVPILLNKNQIKAGRKMVFDIVRQAMDIRPLPEGAPGLRGKQGCINLTKTPWRSTLNSMEDHFGRS